MTAITVAITTVNDLPSFVEGSSRTIPTVLDMGCLHTQMIQVNMGGDAAGTVGVSFEWETMDQAFEGSKAINQNEQILQVMGDCGVTLHRRSILAGMGEMGERRGSYLSCVYTSGIPNAEGRDAGWDIMKEGANGLMGCAAVANGVAPWTGCIFSWTDSVDSLMAASAKAWSSSQMQATQAKYGTRPEGRVIGTILASS